MAAFRRNRQTTARVPAGRPTAEMNVTPLVDVLLVLLVIFMAAAIVRIVDAARGAGVNRVGIITESMRRSG